MGTHLTSDAQSHEHSHSHSGGRASGHVSEGHKPDGHAAGEAVGSPREFWEQRYAGSGTGTVWSGRVNRSLADVVSDFTPGRSLDLGCGEGGDVLWLAERGWRAVGLELSETAVTRARAAADERGIGDARFVQVDLGEWAAMPGGVAGKGETGEGAGASGETGAAGAGAGLGGEAGVGVGADAHTEGDAVEVIGPFDLITASFLQSPVELPRERILRAAASRVSVGGRLVVIAHAAPPRQMPNHPGDFPSPAEELALLALDPASWEVEVAEVRVRQGQMPDGTQADFEDTVVVARRVA